MDTNMDRTMELIINRAILAMALAAKTISEVENASAMVTKVLLTHPAQTVRAVMPVAEMISNACSLRGNSAPSDSLNKAILALAFAAKNLNGLQNASDLVGKALASHSGTTVEAVVPVADMLSNACLMRLLPITSVGSNSGAGSSGSLLFSGGSVSLSSGSVSAAASPVSKRKAVSITSFKPRSIVENMPFSFAEFSRFAVDTETGAKPITENEFMIAEKLYDSADYISCIEKKDTTAPKFAAYKAAKHAEYKARGLCLDKETFMFKTLGLASSLRAKSALWTKYSTCCDLLMGFKRYECGIVGEPAAKRAKASSDEDDDDVLAGELSPVQRESDDSD